jgi:hypothetical protein
MENRRRKIFLHLALHAARPPQNMVAGGVGRVSPNPEMRAMCSREPNRTHCPLAQRLRAQPTANTLFPTLMQGSER